MRARAAVNLWSRFGSALSARAAAAAPQAQATMARGYAIGSAAAAGAALASGTTLKVMGYEVPYSAILGTSLGIGLGLYFYETLVSAREQDQPLQQMLQSPSTISSLNMTSQDGKTVTATTLAGKHALLTFGVLKKDADIDGLNVVVRAAEAAKERTGAEVVPVFISLDPDHDKPQHLRKIAQAAGSPSLLALTGDAEGVLASADKTKKREIARKMAAMKDQEHYKKDEVYDALDISEFIYLVNPEGQIVKMWPKLGPVTGIAVEVANYIRT